MNRQPSKFLKKFLLEHQPKSMESAFAQYRKCRKTGLNPPKQVMKYMFKYLDQVAEQKHKARIREDNPILVGYWEIDERVAHGEKQEDVITEVAYRLGKNFDSYKRQYFRWRKNEILPD